MCEVDNMEWINVKDAVPEEDRPILVYVRNACGYAVTEKMDIVSHGKQFFEGSYVTRNNYGFLPISSGVNQASVVTHWMYAPDPPEM